MLLELHDLDQLTTVLAVSEHFAFVFDMVLHHWCLFKLLVVFVTVLADVHDLILSIRTRLQRDLLSLLHRFVLVSELFEKATALINLSHGLAVDHLLCFIPLVVVDQLAGLVDNINLVRSCRVEVCQQLNADSFVKTKQDHVCVLPDQCVVYLKVLDSVGSHSLDVYVILPELVLVD